MTISTWSDSNRRRSLLEANQINLIKTKQKGGEVLVLGTYNIAIDPLRPTYTGQLLSCDFVAQQKLQVALNFSTRNFYHATSDKKRSRCSHIRCSYGSESTQLRKIDDKSVVGTFCAIVAVLVLCESAHGEEIVANGPGNGLSVDPGFEFITRWYRNCVSAMKQGTGIFTYGCGHFR